MATRSRARAGKRAVGRGRVKGADGAAACAPSLPCRRLSSAADAFPLVRNGLRKYSQAPVRLRPSPSPLFWTPRRTMYPFQAPCTSIPAGTRGAGPQRAAAGGQGAARGAAQQLRGGHCNSVGAGYGGQVGRGAGEQREGVPDRKAGEMPPAVVCVNHAVVLSLRAPGSACFMHVSPASDHVLLCVS